MRHLLPLVLCLGCGAPRDDEPQEPLAPLEATAEPSGPVTTGFRVDWTSPAAGRSWVEYGLTEPLDRATPTGPLGTEHTRFLVGLKPDRDYLWRAVTELEDGRRATSPIGSLHTGSVPAGLRAPELVLSEPGSKVAGGFVQFSQVEPNLESWAMIVDGDGEVVWWHRAPNLRLVTTSRVEGCELRFIEQALSTDTSLSRLHRVRLDTGEVGLASVPDAHHDFHVWPDGTIATIVFELDEQDLVVSDAIVEISPSGESRRVFSWLDDYPVAPWPVCEHSASWTGDPDYQEWTHSNSLVLHPDGEHYLLMSKYQDAVLKIRRSDGAIAWQLGGPYSDFTLPGGAPAWTGLGQTGLFSHAHMSHAYPAPAGSGFDLCLAVFDNGLHYPLELTGLVEICLDEGSLLAERTWSHPDPDGGFTILMGDLRRLDDGWLAGWSELDRVEELSTEGEVRWQLQTHTGLGTGRVQFLEALDCP